MIEGAYLSEAIHVLQIQKGMLNVIVSPTGSGKTYFATHDLLSLSSRPEHIVYLIDTNAAKEQILNHYDNTQRYSWLWRESITDEMVLFEGGKITIMTYHTFGLIAKKKPQFLEKLELIVCDELHNIFWMCEGNTSEEYERGASYALDTLREIIASEDIYCVALTATPGKLHRYFGSKINSITPSKPVRKYETLAKCHYCNLESILSKVEKGKQYIVYIPRITQMKQYLATLQSKGLRAQGIWSLHAKDHPMTQEQLALRAYLLTKQCLPPDLDVLMINRAYETSINIFGSIQAIFIHCNDADTIDQVRGRYRGDLPILYIFSPEQADIELPPGYSNRLLFAEDKKELAEKIHLCNQNSRTYKWPTLKKRIQEQGFEIRDGRLNNRRYSIIIAPS